MATDPESNDRLYLMLEMLFKGLRYAHQDEHADISDENLIESFTMYLKEYGRQQHSVMLSDYLVPHKVIIKYSIELSDDGDL